MFSRFSGNPYIFHNWQTATTTTTHPPAPTRTPHPAPTPRTPHPPPDCIFIERLQQQHWLLRCEYVKASMREIVIVMRPLTNKWKTSSWRKCHNNMCVCQVDS